MKKISIQIDPTSDFTVELPAICQTGLDGQIYLIHIYQSTLERNKDFIRMSKKFGQGRIFQSSYVMKL